MTSHGRVLDPAGIDRFRSRLDRRLLVHVERHPVVGASASDDPRRFARPPAGSEHRAPAASGDRRPATRTGSSVHRLQRLVACELHVAHCLDDIIAPLRSGPLRDGQRQPAVDRHGRAGDIVGRVESRNSTSVGDFLRACRRGPRGSRLPCAAVLPGSSIADWFIGVRIIPGATPLTAIRLRREFQRERRGQLRQAALGAIVFDPAGARRALVDRADIDDPPAALAGPRARTRGR